MPEFDAYNAVYEREINDAIGFSGKSHDFFTGVKADYLSDIFIERFPAGTVPRVLDIGCGNGGIHPMLTGRRREIELTGIDVAGEVIASAREMHPFVHYDVYDGMTLPYPDGSFDAAYTICVMHHVPPQQWEAFMAEMKRVLRPGGLAIVIEHNPLNPITQRIVNNCPLDRNAVLLSSTQVKALMQRAGLCNVDRRFILFTPFDGAFFRKLDRWCSPVPLGAQYIATGQIHA